MSESKQILQIPFELPENLVTFLKAWKFSLDIIWKGKAFQTLGPCIHRLLVQKET